jgi:hypothetical protein
MKLCSSCKIEKPEGEYWSDKRRTSGLMSRCKACKTRDRHEWRSRNPEADRQRDWANPQKERERHLVRKYGVSLSDYDRMMEKQGGSCAICRKTQERAFDVDHNHKTGAVRGLLCTSCNRMLGHAGDSPETLRAAADYLSCRKSPPSLSDR